MPLYEYECDACGRRFERIQKFSDPLETVCPTCGGAVRKLLSSPAIQFKGSGFYITDYVKTGAGSEGGKKAADGAAGSAETAEAKPNSASPTEGKSAEMQKAEPAKTESTQTEPAKTPATTSSPKT